MLLYVVKEDFPPRRSVNHRYWQAIYIVQVKMTYKILFYIYWQAIYTVQVKTIFLYIYFWQLFIYFLIFLHALSGRRDQTEPWAMLCRTLMIGWRVYLKNKLAWLGNQGCEIYGN
jgi:hypothetical protein